MGREDRLYNCRGSRLQVSVTSCGKDDSAVKLKRQSYSDVAVVVVRMISFHPRPIEYMILFISF